MRYGAVTSEEVNRRLGQEHSVEKADCLSDCHTQAVGAPIISTVCLLREGILRDQLIEIRCRNLVWRLRETR